MFQLSKPEAELTSSQNVMTSTRPKTALPYAFTEQGVAMLSGILKSDIAIAANIAIMRAFIQVQEYLLDVSVLSAEMKELKARVDLLQLQNEENSESVCDLSEELHGEIDNLYLAIAELSAKIDEKKKEPRRRIGF